jgi:hypothetical protein
MGTRLAWHLFEELDLRMWLRVDALISDGGRLPRVASGQFSSFRSADAERPVRVDALGGCRSAQSKLTVQCNGAVVRSNGYTNPIYFPRRTAVLYRRNSAVYF